MKLKVKVTMIITMSIFFIAIITLNYLTDDQIGCAQIIVLVQNEVTKECSIAGSTCSIDEGYIQVSSNECSCENLELNSSYGENILRMCLEKEYPFN